MPAKKAKTETEAPADSVDETKEGSEAPVVVDDKAAVLDETEIDSLVADVKAERVAAQNSTLASRAAARAARAVKADTSVGAAKDTK